MGPGISSISESGSAVRGKFPGVGPILVSETNNEISAGFTDVEPSAKFGSGVREKPSENTCLGADRRFVTGAYLGLGSSGFLKAAKLL